MAKVGAQRAAELTGRSKSTIQRAMNSGKLSYEMDANDRRVIDVSELERAFGLEKSTAPASANSVEQELQKASAMIEMERMKMRITMLEHKLEAAEQQIADLKEQRDSWQKQAQQVLLTSQHSQKQADELREELKERERKAQARRQEILAQRMKKLAQQNANDGAQKEDAQGESASKFQSIWKKMKRA